MISTVLPAATLFRIPIPEIMLKRGRTTMIAGTPMADTKLVWINLFAIKSNLDST